MDALKPDSPPELLNAKAVGKLLDCSARHVIRLAEAGRLPVPVRLGHLVRWRRAEILLWLEGGCRPVRSGKASR